MGSFVSISTLEKHENNSVLEYEMAQIGTTD